MAVSEKVVVDYYKKKYGDALYNVDTIEELEKKLELIITDDDELEDILGMISASQEQKNLTDESWLQLVGSDAAEVIQSQEEESTRSEIETEKLAENLPTASNLLGRWVNSYFEDGTPEYKDKEALLARFDGDHFKDTFAGNYFGVMTSYEIAAYQRRFVDAGIIQEELLADEWGTLGPDTQNAIALIMNYANSYVDVVDGTNQYKRMEDRLAKELNLEAEEYIGYGIINTLDREGRAKLNIEDYEGQYGTGLSLSVAMQREIFELGINAYGEDIAEKTNAQRAQYIKTLEAELPLTGSGRRLTPFELEIYVDEIYQESLGRYATTREKDDFATTYAKKHSLFLAANVKAHTALAMNEAYADYQTRAFGFDPDTETMVDRTTVDRRPRDDLFKTDELSDPGVASIDWSGIKSEAEFVEAAKAKQNQQMQLNKLITGFNI